MSVISEIPREFGYVLSVAATSFFLNTALGFQVSAYRKAAGIKYPIAYANDELAAKDPKAFQFNCARSPSHSSVLKICLAHTSWLGALLISGLRYPVASASFGAAWIVSRVLYGRGYAVKGPEGRLGGAYLGFFADIAIKSMAMFTSVMFALGY
ncbi:glutathione S-transferase [Ceratocystis lukuohia]|uniref:Glutathione S-transferase n=1 Tax=Ceratocystis lukuohia TaxID=2019550 RepID=A0ABR4MIQ7_9PEZI